MENDIWNVSHQVVWNIECNEIGEVLLNHHPEWEIVYEIVSEIKFPKAP